ncbi:integration host factor, actinobacterial type [Streptomyces sp. NPDC101490]|uniref:integration host factor, actinobacterial type n=1 Tax=Streptomyces sp. NPDC101490 TaxID=3366143 RepID=UPI0038125713
MAAEARAGALEKATVARKEHGELLAQFTYCRVSLEAVLSREGVVVGKVRVSRPLEALPGVGEVRAGRLPEELGLSESHRVQGLGARQRERLLGFFPPTAWPTTPCRGRPAASRVSAFSESARPGPPKSRGVPAALSRGSEAGR